MQAKLGIHVPLTANFDMLSITELLIAASKHERTQAKNKARDPSTGQKTGQNGSHGQSNAEDSSQNSADLGNTSGVKAGANHSVITERDVRVPNVFSRIGGISACAAGDLGEARRLVQV